MTRGEHIGTNHFTTHPLLEQFVKAMIIIVFLISSLTIAEWIAGISLTKSYLWKFQTMRLITATLLALSAVSLWSSLYGSRWSRRLLLITGIIILSVGLLTIVTYLWSIEPSVFRNPLLDFFLQPYKRMALHTAIIFLFIGVIFILFSNHSRVQDDIAHVLFFPAVSLSYFSFVSYILGISEIFMIEEIVIAPHAAFSLFLLCIVILLVKPDTWLMRILSGSGPGSLMGRRLLPWILVVPVIISWIRITADHEGYFSQEIGAIVAAIIYTVSFLFLVWYSALSVNKIDQTRQNAFEALHESESRINALITATSDVVYFMSADWKHLNYLKGGNFIQSVKEPVHDWINILVPKSEQPLVLETIQKAINEKSKFELEHKVINADGTIGWTLSRAIPILDDNGEIIEWMGIAEDITELKKAQEELLVKERNEAMRLGAESALLKLNEELKRSNQELQQFAYLASHDLQEPLRTISTFTEILSRKYKGHFDDEGEKMMHYIVQSSLRLKSLISALLTYSTIGSSNSQFTEVDFNLVFSNVVNDLAPVIKKKNAIVTSGDLPTVSGDEVQLFHLLRSLVDNSLKFSARTPEVHVSAEEEPDNYLFSVRDNGIGIEYKYSDKIYLMFQRLVSRREYEGTGIGLAISKRIIERHGGKIYFESKPNEGTTFFFTIAKNENY